MIENIKEKSIEANKLRKDGKYEEAIQIYKEIINESNNAFDFAGYINCLKKIDNIETAFVIADEACRNGLNQEWLNNEIIWLYIHFIIDVQKENVTVDACLKIFNQLITRTTSELQRVKIYSWTFKVLKNHKRWGDLCNVIATSNSDEFSMEPIVIDGKEGWSHSAVWHHYNLLAIINHDQADKSDKVDYVSDLISRFPHQKKYFIRLKALLFVNLKEYDKAREVFLNLLKIDSKSSWIQSDYAGFLRTTGKKSEALDYYYNAMQCSGKIESKINVLKNIAELAYEMNDYTTAFIFYCYYKEIRDNHSWPEKLDVTEKIKELKILVEAKYIDLSSYKNECKRLWQKENNEKNNKLSIEFEGHILMHDESKPYCFIKAKDGNYFCSKSDLPKGAKDGEKVTFFVKKTFDKKKNVESYSAVRINYLK